MAKQTTKPMELTQATQLVQWLEEERRKDKILISTLQEQTRSQELKLDQQAAQIQEIQTTFAGIQGLVARATDFEKTLSTYKDELLSLLDQREEKWKKDRLEADRMRTIELDAMKKQLGEFEQSAQFMRRMEEDLQMRQIEEKRLNEVLQRLEQTTNDLKKTSDDRVQSVTYLEEQRRSDNRRLAELEQDTTDLRKKAEVLNSKMSLLEDTLTKQKSTLNSALSQIKEFEKTMEKFEKAEFRREQDNQKTRDTASRLKEDADHWQEQTTRFMEQFQSNKRALDKMEGFQSRVEKRQNEVAEMQRLAEDRLKRQWEEWQAATDKESKRRQLVLDEQSKLLNRSSQDHTRRIETLEARADTQQSKIETLFDFRRMDAHRELTRLQDEVERSEEAFTDARDAMRAHQ